MKKIMDMTPDELKNALITGSVTVCVVGIGRIGLPTALSFANSGLFTIGLDINSELVKNINSGIYPLKDEPEYDIIFDKVINEKKFFATTDIKKSVTKADIILLSLPTPMDKNNVPDYSALRSVGKQLSEYLSEGSIVIIESTIEPGFVENEFVSIIEGLQNRLKVEKNFAIGVCPETANPGEIMVDFTKLPRLVAGINENITNLIHEIYHFVFPVELIHMPNCKTASAVKLTTNVFRDVNIAFVNELSLLFEKLGIDTMTVLKAAQSKYNFQVHYPGAGVGGPCLPVNSYQILNSGKNVGIDSLKLVKACREINESMPQHVIELLQDCFAESNLDVKGSTILILGISYKPNVKDIQLSPAEPIIQKLSELGAHIRIFDPYFVNEKVYGIQSEDNLNNALVESDAALIITAHKEFLDIEPYLFSSKLKNKILVDSRGIVDPKTAKNIGLIFRGLGRGI
ncbi:MAG: GDP-mannose dehydrogenase [Thaumarchaeota archaeon]|nr:MAG: GDP-mannose dehydrogenase [Nitrososphaerota archaeon]